MMAVLAFLWSMGAAAGVKLSETLFLLHVGADELPYAFLITSFTLFGVAYVLLKAVQRMSAYSIFYILSWLGTSFYGLYAIAIWVGLINEDSNSFVAAMVGSYLFLLVSITCYWSFVDEYYDLQDSKRLFGVFCSAIFLGMICAGLLLSWGQIPVEGLFGIIAACFASAALWSRLIKKHEQVAYDDTRGEDEVAHKVSLPQALRLIAKSPMTLLLLLTPILGQSMEVITEYNFLHDFEEHFVGNLDLSLSDSEDAALTLFMGRLSAAAALLSMVIGLLLTSRLLKRWGVNNMIVVLPGIYFCTFLGWNLFPSLCFPIMGFAITEGLSYAIQDNNVNLLLNAVPAKLKSRLRVCLGFFSEPTGMLVGSTVIALAKENSLYIGLAVAGIALCVAMGLRAYYLQALLSHLASHAISFKRTARDFLGDLSGKDRDQSRMQLFQQLESADLEKQALALKMLLVFPDKYILPRVLLALDELSVESKLQAISCLADSPHSGDPRTLRLLRRWSQGEEEEVRIKSAALYSLAKQGEVESKTVAMYLDSPNLHLRAAAIIAVYQSIPGSSLVDQRLWSMLSSDVDAEVRMGIELLAMLRHADALPRLLEFLQHPSKLLSHTAARVIPELMDRKQGRHAPLLLQILGSRSDPVVRKACLQSLAQLADPGTLTPIIRAGLHFRPSERRLAEKALLNMGHDVIEELLAHTRDTSLPDRCRLLAGRALCRMAPQLFREHVWTILLDDMDRAYFYYYHCHTVQKQNPLYDLKMLSDTLRSSYYSVIDFIIQILAVAGSVEDAELLSHALRSRNAKVHGNAVETLEKTCDPQIFKRLCPLIDDDIPLQDVILLCQQEGVFSLPLPDLLEQLGHSPVQADQLIAARVKTLLPQQKPEHALSFVDEKQETLPL